MIHAITLGFSPARIISGGMEKFYLSVDSKPINHYLIDQHYPLNQPGELRDIAARWGITVIDSGYDRGLHNGFNFAFEKINPADDDILVMFDPDSGPVNHSWDTALIETVQAGYAVAASCDDRILEELVVRGHRQLEVRGRKIWEPVTNCIFSVTAWDVSFIRKMGGFHEENAYYGGLESYVWNKLREQGRKMAYLPDYREENSLRALADPEYTAWKWAHAQLKTFPGSFGEFIAQGCPGFNHLPKDPP